MKEDQPIVFAYYNEDEFLGYRCDSFGTLSKKYAKVYNYSKSQIDIVVKSIKDELNHTGSRILSVLTQLGAPAMTAEGQSVDLDKITTRIKEQEDSLRNYKSLQVRVQPWLTQEVWNEISGEGEEWKVKEAIAKLEPATEVYKFATLENEN